MIRKQLATISIVIFLILVFSNRLLSQEMASPDSAIVKETIEQSIGWAIEKDFDTMYHLWAENMFHFWLFSNSRVIGLDNFKIYAQHLNYNDFIGTLF
jgi:hypothetical protein